MRADWAEPTDTDFAYVRIDINVNAAGWVPFNAQAEVAAGDSMHFNRALAGTETERAGYRFERHISMMGMFSDGDTVAVRARSVDTFSNESAWSVSDTATLRPPDYPAPEYVLTGHTTNYADGVYAYAPPAHVEQGYEYGANGTQYTGSLVVTVDVPAQPILSVSDLGDGTVRIAVTGATDATTNVVYVRAADGSWPEAATVTFSGDGSEDVPLAAGVYFARVISSNASQCAAPGQTDPVWFAAADTADDPSRSAFGDTMHALDLDMLAAFGQSVTYSRGDAVVTLTGILGPAVTEYDDRAAMRIAVGDASLTVLGEDLDFGAGAVEPRLHDAVRTDDGRTYTVMQPGKYDRERLMRKIPLRKME
jgi:hypothetical protein